MYIFSKRIRRKLGPFQALQEGIYESWHLNSDFSILNARHFES